MALSQIWGRLEAWAAQSLGAIADPGVSSSGGAGQDRGGTGDGAKSGRESTEKYSWGPTTEDTIQQATTFLLKAAML